MLPIKLLCFYPLSTSSADSATRISSTPSRPSCNDPTMQICYVLYFTLIAYLLAVTIPGSQERWSALNMNVVSLISHIHSTTSTTLLSYCFSFVTSSLSAEKRFSSAGRIDVCRLSPLRTDGTCHPLDSPTTPTPTLILNTSATRTGSAIAASPIGYNPTPYNDAFFLSLDTRNAPRKSEGFKSRKDEIPSNSVGPSCLLSAMTSTMIIVQCLMVRHDFDYYLL
ncbi:hypothetical protein BJ322DRAFT_1056398 [Thelephora terrestris]|uniref:Uncharacterized protein n=1 Tax=Thelephora terrestris TaxID=56493 RepID=A0A9P6L7A3_9AGAM|nr:hypothetical protein BJ322DRAFT_1056398 [Thelephora terrestris]